MKYFSMFSGVGGFDLALNNLDHECVGYSEIDKFACKVYEKHFGGVKNYGDATTIRERELPEFDLLCGGFPCQAFSLAGKRRGFEDTRGTLFFDIARIIKSRKPKMVFLENVKGLLSHDDRRTFITILATFDELGYDVEWQVLNSKDFGVPQNRERVFIIGHLRGERWKPIFPIGEDAAEVQGIHGKKGVKISNSSPRIISPCITQAVGRRGCSDEEMSQVEAVAKCVVLEQQRDGIRDYDGYTPVLRANMGTGGNNVPIVMNLQPRSADRPSLLKDPKSGGHGTICKFDEAYCLDSGCSQGVYEFSDGMLRRLTPTECERLQAFPDGWTAFGVEKGKTVKISDSQRYKMMGNAVTVSVVEYVARRFK